MGSGEPGQIVARGYDRVAERYQAWTRSGQSDGRAPYLQLLLERLPAGAHVLELGCGAGSATTRALAERFDVIGADISPRSVELARQRVQGATFICADMATLDFETNRFDAVAAFYSLTHVPRNQHAGLLQRIACWLRPGGILVATMGAGDEPGDVEEDWLGVPMYFSHFGAEANKRLVESTGLTLVEAVVRTEDEDGVPVRFLWVVAEQP